MGIETKTLGMLIDELITTSMKCWHAQDNLMNKDLSQAERLAAAEHAQTLNKRRNELIAAIDRVTNQDGSPTPKTY